jgi:bacillithiol biosynthesis deacetylase BshB1
MSTTPVDVLAIGAHPDDVELNVGGTLLLAKKQGLRGAICHLTDGEMGTRGSRESRKEEARAAAEQLGIVDLKFLGLPDGCLEVTQEAKDKVVRTIREFRPRIILAPYWVDLHPDHAATGNIVKQANFLAGLSKLDTGQEPWRADVVMYYMSHTQIDVSIVVDITDEFAAKKSAAECYKSQFFQRESTERKTFISGEGFWGWWKGRASYWGHLVGATYGEPFLIEGPIPVKHPFDLFFGFGKYKNS